MSNPTVRLQKFSYSVLLLVAVAIPLASCTPEGIGRDDVVLPEQAVSAGSQAQVVIETLSTKPWLVTGDDVLVRVSWPDDQQAVSLRIELNGENVTSSLVADPSGRSLTGLLTDLKPGSNTVVAAGTVDSTAVDAALEITNYPVTGPIISGPHEQPFYCQTQEFELANGESLGPPLDSHCSVATRVDYVYFSELEQTFLPLASTDVDTLSQGIATVSLSDGETVPFIVRVETGTVNRAIYEIAMLHAPGTPEPGPWNRSPGWNGKLVYTHGGGCRGGWYQQGNRTGGVLRAGLLEMGYAVTSSSLNVFGQNCNDLLASETHIMVKERFVEHYGEPIYTIGTGGSGGSYQSHQTADNYPGIFDGIIVSSSFPDVTSATIFTLADARLLNYYFAQVNPEGLSEEQQQAIAGFGSWGSIPNLARGAARLDPIYAVDSPLEEQGGEFGIEALESRRYGPGRDAGVRATVYDHTVNVYGQAENSAWAARPLDNVGVQYGLAALNDEVITPQQFIDLNRDIGGFDRDMNHVPQRHRADSKASKAAVESGRILFGGAGLRETPVIDYRSYTDHRETGDIHMIVHQYSTRQRLIDANGHADNHVMSVGGLWGYSADEPDLGNLFGAMDQWLMAIKANQSEMDQAAKVVNAKPFQLTDNCWDYSEDERVNIQESLSFANSGKCGELYPAYPTPRHVAGAPLANNIISCQLVPIDPNNYRVSFTAEELAQLDQVFPQGVCDWSLPDVHGARHQGTWLSFGPSPVNRMR
ncbi:MAG: hypothetical protein KJN90_08225 [Gammaproteobacteria bacterium]|nr:hypothetical protein [Gammaproteobacteria bacterium]